MSAHDNNRLGTAAIERSIAVAKAGSYSALGQLLYHYRDYLLRVANDELQSDLFAKVAPSDLVQETFLQAVRDFPRFRGGTDEELRAWLRQMLLHNLCDAAKSYRETGKRLIGLEVPLGTTGDNSARGRQLTCEQPSPADLVISAETWQLLEFSLGQLSREYRRVIELRTFEGRPFEEVGDELGRSSEAARKLWSRAIEKLNAEMLARKSDARRPL